MNMIDRTFEQLRGQLAWNVRYHRMLNLSIDFGEPSLRILREPRERLRSSARERRLSARRVVCVEGRWFLWIYLAYWRVLINGKRVTSSSSSARDINLALQDLEGQRFVGVQINPDTGFTRFAFDLGGAIEVRRMQRNAAQELWSLSKPTGYYLSVYGDGTYSHDRGTTQLGKENRRRIRA